MCGVCGGVCQCHSGCAAVHRNSDDALEARGAWCPSEESWTARREQQWLELDLGATRVVLALRVRGDQQYVRLRSPPLLVILTCAFMPCRASPRLAVGLDGKIQPLVRTRVDFRSGQMDLASFR